MVGELQGNKSSTITQEGLLGGAVAEYDTVLGHSPVRAVGSDIP